MSIVLKVLSALLFLLAAFPALAQSTASPVVPGYWTTTPQPNCTGTQCFVQYGPSGGGGTPTNPGSIVVVPSGNAATGIAPIVAGPSANSAVLKAAPGNFYGVTVTPTSAVYIFLINATSLPANATLTPGLAAGNLQECVGLAPANLTSTFDFGSGPSEVFSTGITVALSSTACPVLTASAVGTINGRAQ